MNDFGSVALLRSRLRTHLEGRWWQIFIMSVIIINAVTLGLETSKTVMEAIGPVLLTLDKIALTIFVIEIILKLTAYGWRYFRSGWNLFDFTIVMVTLLPASGNLSVLRAMRILRAMRLLSVVPAMRHVVQAILLAIPGMTSIVLLMALIFYIGAVMATKLFGSEFPQWFGTIGESTYTLFQIMTLESWSMGIVRPVMDAYPQAWLFFVPFLLVTSFAVLNLFIGVIVDSMQRLGLSAEESDRGQGTPSDKASDTVLADELSATRESLKEMRSELAALREAIATRPKD